MFLYQNNFDRDLLFWKVVNLHFVELIILTQFMFLELNNVYKSIRYLSYNVLNKMH